MALLFGNYQIKYSFSRGTPIARKISEVTYEQITRSPEVA